MSKRIFIALDISDKAREKIARFAGELRTEFPDIRVGWEKPEKIHLTLKFLGDTDEERRAKVKGALQKSAEMTTPFSLTVENTGCFPTPRKARILWLGLTDETGGLQKIQGRLEEELEFLGFERDDREFKPHLTVARLREPQKAGRLVEAFLRKQFEPVSFEVSEIVIYESKLQPTGSVYSVIERRKF